jgi:hypothetical protein
MPDAAVAQTFSYMQGVVAPARLTDGITNREMSKLLKEAAAESEQTILTLVGNESFTSQTRLRQIGAIRAGIEPISTEPWNKTGKVTEVGMFQQAQLAADQAMDRDFFLGMPGLAVTQYARQMHIAAAAGIQSVLSRRTTGYVLAERIYANGKATTATVGRIVDRGLINQKSARQIAKEVKGFYSPDVPGGASYAAMRLARTEINNAHHHTSIRMGQERPWVTGFEWNLSRSHPKPDPCDELAEADDYGLGPGKYPKSSAPDRPHPQCLCFLTHLQEDDDAFIDGLAGGHYDSWLEERGIAC